MLRSFGLERELSYQIGFYDTFLSSVIRESNQNTSQQRGVDSSGNMTAVLVLFCSHQAVKMLSSIECLLRYSWRKR